jgi:hypothetical protein
LTLHTEAEDEEQEEEDEVDEDENEDVTPKQMRDWLLVDKVDSVFGHFETLERGWLSAVVRRMGFPSIQFMVGGVIG